MAKESKQGILKKKDKEIIGEMMSKDTLGNSYSVDINVSQMIYHDLNSSIHYAPDYFQPELEENPDTLGSANNPNLEGIHNNEN